MRKEKRRTKKRSYPSTVDMIPLPHPIINVLTLTETKVTDPLGSESLPTKKGGNYQ
jgi:hypothetical protein